MSFRHLPFRPLARLALAIACAMAAPAMAAGKDDPAARNELEQARTELQAAAARLAELSRGMKLDDATRRSLQLAMERAGAPGRPRLGVLLGADAQAGVRIAGVTPGGGADKAGLKSGDRLLEIDGRPVAGDDGKARVAAARNALAGLNAERPVRITYQRDGRQHEVEVTPAPVRGLAFARDLDLDLDLDGRDFAALVDDAELARLRALGPQLRGEVLQLARSPGCDGGKCRAPLLAEALRWDGLNLLALEPGLGRYFGTDRGVLVLQQGSLPGLQPGDVVQDIEGKPVASPREAMQAMTAKKPGEQARFGVLRDRARHELQVTVPDRLRTLDFVPVPPAPPSPPAPPAPPAAPRTTSR